MLHKAHEHALVAEHRERRRGEEELRDEELDKQRDGGKRRQHPCRHLLHARAAIGGVRLENVQVVLLQHEDRTVSKGAPRGIVRRTVLHRCENFRHARELSAPA